MKKLFFVGLIVCLFSACSDDKPKKTIVGQDGKEYTVVDENAKAVKKIIYYGNGVYYFNYTGGEFADGLSQFIGEHKNLELISFSGNGTGKAAYEQGRDCGYFVVFREKPVEKKTE
jgi:hypothetical protein